MSQTIAVRFYARRTRVNQSGLVPIYMRLVIGEERISIVTNISVKPQDWTGEKISATSEEAKKLNKCLEAFKLRAFDLQRELMTEGKAVTLEHMKLKWDGKSLEKPVMLMEVFSQHNKQMALLVDKEYSPLTLERYETSYRHTQAFIQWKFKKDDIDIKEMKFEFIADYEFWLKTERKCEHNTTVKYLSNFKKIVHICMNNGWLAKDPFVGFKMAKREIERPFLVQEELDAIINKDFPIHRIDQVRDIFVFCCYTGLSYVDVANLTSEDITTGIDGEKWIWCNRHKTDAPTRVPLLPPAMALLEKYKDYPICVRRNRLLPVSSNQKMNNYLKEIADACGITKKMTFHTSRHTFATTVTLSNGVPIETVGKMLGHRNLRTTQHYARILEKKVSEDMGTLRQKLSLNKALV
ncbi:MAG: site-specific integrase [Bacteroidetes bacterium]|nr:site-specific integrase [Bacteroidota bacterium]